VQSGASTISYELSFHSLRHTAVSLLKDAGIPEAAVMELGGHDSKQMSAHYTHVDPKPEWITYETSNLGSLVFVRAKVRLVKSFHDR
jgi:hypothetical protein